MIAAKTRTYELISQVVPNRANKLLKYLKVGSSLLISTSNLGRSTRVGELLKMKSSDALESNCKFILMMIESEIFYCIIIFFITATFF